MGNGEEYKMAIKNLKIKCSDGLVVEFRTKKVS